MTDLAETIARWKSSIPNFDLLGEVSGSFVVSYKEALALLDAAEAGVRARDAALEEAAKVCDDAASMAPSTEYGGGFTDGVTWAAANIRSRKGAA